MGRRARNRVRARETGVSIPRDRMARVRVDEKTWREFRQAVGAQPIAERLGELVARDIAAHRRHRMQTGDLTAREVLHALERVGEMSRDLDAITRRLELLRTAPRRAGIRVEPGRPRPAAHRPILGEGGERPTGQPNDAFADLFSYPDRDDDAHSHGKPSIP